MDILDELRQKTEKRYQTLDKEPQKWEEREDISHELVAPEVGHLVAEFLAGEFNFQDFFQLSTTHREEFIEFLDEEYDIEFKLTINGKNEIPA